MKILAGRLKKGMIIYARPLKKRKKRIKKKKKKKLSGYWPVDLIGEVKIATHYFKDDEVDLTKDYMFNLSGRIGAKIKKGQWNAFLLMYTSLQEPKNYYSYIEELFFEYNFENWKFFAGMMIHDWAATDFFGAADSLNSRNFESVSEDLAKIGEVTISAKYFLDNGAVSVYFLPMIVSPHFPALNDRRSFIPQEFSYTNAIFINRSGEKQEGLLFPQWGGKFDYSFESFDISLQYLDHIDRHHPLSYVDYINKKISPVFLASHQFGVTGQKTFEQVSLSFEVFYKSFTQSILLSEGEYSLPDYYPTSIGIDYRWNLMEKFNIRNFFEYQEYLGLDSHEQKTLGMFQKDLLFGMEVDFGGLYADLASLMYLFDIDDNKDFQYIMTYSRRLNDTWKISSRFNFSQRINPFSLDQAYLTDYEFSLSFMKKF